MSDEPWEVDIAVLTNREIDPIDPNKALTFVVCHWMWNGDLRPLAWAIRNGYVIDEAILECLANMILDQSTSPYKIETKAVRRRGAPKKMDKFARDHIAALLYEKNKTRGNSKQTFEKIAETLIGDYRNNPIVRQAVTKHRKHA